MKIKQKFKLNDLSTSLLSFMSTAIAKKVKRDDITIEFDLEEEYIYIFVYVLKEKYKEIKVKYGRIYEEILEFLNEEDLIQLQDN